jgi:hypothetical protein
MLKAIGEKIAPFSRWYFQKGKRLIITIPLFLDTIYLWIMGFVYMLLLFPAVERMGGAIIFFLGVGFVLTLAPVIMALIYFTYPSKKAKRLRERRPELSEKKLFVLTVVNMLAMRILFTVAFYVLGNLIRA